MTDFSQPGPSRYGGMSRAASTAAPREIEPIETIDDDYSSHWPPSAQKQPQISNHRQSGKGKSRETLEQITEFDDTQDINADLTPAQRTASSNVDADPELQEDRSKGSSRIDKGLEAPFVMDDAASTWGGDSP